MKKNTSVSVDQALYESVMAYKNPVLIAKYRKKYGVTTRTAQKHFQELKKFLLLTSVAKQSIAPSQKIDQVWHEFILFTKDYRQFCTTNFGKIIEHVPEIATGKRQATKAIRRYLETLALAASVYGKLDPEMWPDEKQLASVCSVDDDACRDFFCND